MTMMTSPAGGFGMSFGDLVTPTEIGFSIPLGQRSEPIADFLNDPFRELVNLVQDHDRLVDELAGLKLKLKRAFAYQESEGSHASFAAANIDRIRTKHSILLNSLRANRLLARRFLQKLESDPVTL